MPALDLMQGDRILISSTTELRRKTQKQKKKKKQFCACVSVHRGRARPVVRGCICAEKPVEEKRIIDANCP